MDSWFLIFIRKIAIMPATVNKDNMIPTISPITITLRFVVVGTVVAAPSLVDDDDCFSDCWLLDCCEPLSEVTLTADAVTVAVTVTALELPLDDVEEEVGGDPPPLAESKLRSCGPIPRGTPPVQLDGTSMFVR